MYNAGKFQCLRVMLFLVVAFLSSGRLFAGACAPGTLDEYVALGSTGCYFPDGSLLHDITYGVVGSPLSIVGASIGASTTFANMSVTDTWPLTVNFPELISVAPGEVLEASLQGTIDFGPGVIQPTWDGVVNSSHLGGNQCVCDIDTPFPVSVSPIPSSITFGFNARVADLPFGVARYSSMYLILHATTPEPPVPVPTPEPSTVLVCAAFVLMACLRSRRKMLGNFR
jgi:hypothetical protein